MNHTQRMDAAVARFLFKSASRNGGPRAGLGSAHLAARLYSQSRKRELNAKQGLQVPPVLIMSVTRRCNLNCVGCYSAALRPEKSAELPDERFAAVAEEAIGLGVSSFLVAGGEPFLRPALLRRLAALPGHASAVFTNGTLLGPECLDILASGRLTPVISIEGDPAHTRDRRGAGVHEGAMAKAAFLRREGVPFGFSVTLTSRNAETVLSGRFLLSLAEAGAGALFLVEYVPVSPGTEDLVLGPAERRRLLDQDLLSRLPFPVAALPGDEEAYGGCMAAGRGFMHVDDEGRLEACPFAPYSDTQVATGSLADALKSPLMAAIRERHGELKESSGGCALWNKRGWIASLGACAARDSDAA